MKKIIIFLTKTVLLFAINIIPILLTIILIQILKNLKDVMKPVLNVKNKLMLMKMILNVIHVAGIIIL